MVLEDLQEEASQSSSGLYLTRVVPVEGFQESRAKTAASKGHE